MAKRRRRPVVVRWSDYRAYLIGTYTNRRDAELIEQKTGRASDKISDGSLRGFLLDHERWGIDARPNLWPDLRDDIYLPYNQQWELEMVLADPELIKQTLGRPGYDLKAVRAFIDLWGPKGPLAIPRTEWLADPGFKKWLDARRTK